MSGPFRALQFFCESVPGALAHAVLARVLIDVGSLRIRQKSTHQEQDALSERVKEPKLGSC